MNSSCECTSHTNPEFEKMCQEISEEAKRFINMTKSYYIFPSAVFDIDDTLLLTVCRNCGKSLKRPEPNTEIINLLKWAKKNEIYIHIITARSDEYPPSTINQLKDYGITDFDSLYMMPKNQRGKRLVKDFKSSVRKMIQIKKKYHIIINIGDQECDISGNYSDMVFIIPNNFYKVN